MKRPLCFVIALGSIALALAVQTDAQVPEVPKLVGTGPAWDRFVEQLLERVRAERIPPAPELQPETIESHSLRPERDSDSREALAEVVASMLRVLAPDLLPSGYRLGEKDQRILDLLRALPPNIQQRGDSAFDEFALIALVDAHRALVGVFDSDTDPKKAIKDIGQSVEHLQRAHERTIDPREIAFVDETARKLAGVGELMAREAITHGDASGIDAVVLSEAQLALARSIEAIASGRYADAIREQLITVEAGTIPMLDLNRFERNIVTALHGQTVGFAYAIASNGYVVRAGAEGHARMPADFQVAQSPLKEMNIASTSKTLTAMTLLQLLAEKGVSVDAPVHPWLPASWQKGPGIEHLTFRDLLNHRSGLNSNLDGPYEYEYLRAYAAAGINPLHTLIPHYQNTNYAMFRVIIPFLHHGPAAMNQIDQQFGFLDQITAITYRDIVRARVLAKTGVVVGDCKPSEDQPVQTLMYEFPYFFGHGFADRNWMSRCGSGGWYLSAAEMATILATRRHTNEILSPAAKRQMDEEFLGWGPVYGVRGVYRAHNGGLFYTGGRGLGACWMDYPFGIQAAVLSNSVGGTDDLCNVLRAAFDTAFVDPPGPIITVATDR